MCADEDIAKCLIPFHVITGCYSKSCIYGHGEKSLYETMVKSSEARRILSKCGRSIPFEGDILRPLKLYVNSFVYGDHHSDSLCMVRAVKWKKLK